MIVKKKTLITAIGSFIIGFLIIYATMGFSDSLFDGMLRILVGLLFVVSIILGANQREKINPYILFSLTPLSLLLYNEKLSPRYLTKLDDKTWMLGIICILAFILVLHWYIRGNRIDEENRKIRESKCTTAKEKNLLVKHAIILFVLSLLPDICRLFLGTSFFLGSTIAYFKYPAIACAWKSKSKPLIVLMYVSVLLSFMTTFNKSIFLSVGLITILSYQRYALKDEKDDKKLFAWIAIAACFMVFIAFPMKALVQEQGNFSFSNLFSAISKYYTGEDNSYANKILWNGPIVLQMPYMYLVSAWNNVKYVMQTQSSHTYGLWFFKPVLSWLQLDGLLERFYILKPYSSFNTFGFVTVLYKDFGIIGAMFEAGFLGYFVAKVFNKFRTSNSPIDLAIYALTAQATVEMFFSNHFFMLSYPFTIIVVCWIYKMLFKTAKYI